MSLINEMLRDLDARRASAEGPALAAEVRVVRAEGGSWGGLRVIAWALLVVAVALLAWWFGFGATPSPPSAPEEVAPSTAIVAPQSTPVLAAAPSASEPPPAVATQAAPPVAVAAKPPAPKAAPKRSAPVAAPPAQKADEKPLELKLAPSTLSRLPESPESHLDKRVLPLSAAERAETAYRSALQAVQQGDSDEARAHAESALRDLPEHAGARQLLVRLLLAGREDQAAMAVLERAQRDFPDDLQWALLLARLNLERHGAGPALAQLQRVAEPAGGSHEYRAMLGILYHRLGNAAASADAYRGALRLAPQEGRYWIGLGMSMEAQGEAVAARDAYRQASADAAMPAALRDFVQAKLQ